MLKAPRWTAGAPGPFNYPGSNINLITSGSTVFEMSDVPEQDLPASRQVRKRFNWMLGKCVDRSSRSLLARLRI
jgi:hypothetical protein